jgi:hypothetical protein
MIQSTSWSIEPRGKSSRSLAPVTNGAHEFVVMDWAMYIHVAI